MKQFSLLLLVGAVIVITPGCSNHGNQGGPAANTGPRPTPQPTPDRRQKFSGMYVFVHGVYRETEVKDTFGPDPTKIIRPKKPEDDFATVEIELRTVDDTTFDWESKWDGSGVEVATPEGKILLRGPYRATDSLGNRLAPIQSTVSGDQRKAIFISLNSVYELPRTATIAKVQFEGLTLDAEIPRR